MKQFLKKSILPIATVLLTIVSAQSIAGTNCYDFTNFNNVNVPVAPGETLYFDEGRIEIHHARTVEGVPIINDAQHAEVSSGAIANGDYKEFHGYFVNMQLILNEPKSHVSMKFAQATGPTNQYLYSSVAVNRELIQAANGFASVNGLTLGMNIDEQVQISTSVTSAPLPGENGFVVGTIDYDATDGSSINQLTLGGVQYFLDDICLTN